MKGLGVGRVVHYVAFGTPGGEFPAGACRAAIVTDVSVLIDNQHIDEDGTPTTVSLCVLNPNGLYFNLSVPYDERKAPGTWHWPEAK